MRSLWLKLKNGVFRAATRLFMPDLARQMEQEGVFDLNDHTVPNNEEAAYMRVEDNGADMTILAFAGLDVLYAGLARYEFQKVLHSMNLQANFVFIRDVHRIGFHLRPDGAHGGLAFYEEHIREAIQRLGSTRNIALGSSIGGSAALYFGTRCAMCQIILFGAAFTLDGFTAPRTLLRTIFDVKKIFVEPRAYAEMLIVSISALWGSRQLERRFGAENVARPLDIYRAADPRPKVTLFYGSTAWPDACQAALLQAIPGTTLVPLPTGRHNTPSFLKQQGRLATSIAEAINAR
jgi:hypothetical protein